MKVRKQKVPQWETSDDSKLLFLWFSLMLVKEGGGNSHPYKTFF